jgi:hypothetical protein
MLEALTRKSFDQNLNTLFRADFADAGPGELRLVETSGRIGNGTEYFSLVFRSADPRVFPQQIYRLHHPELGTFDLFLVPIKRDNQGVYYEAVFNRLLADQAT